MSSINARNYTETAPRTVAFLGLGVMGYPMAGHLARAGHRVTVYNRNRAKAVDWCAEFADAPGVASAATPEAAARGCDIVFCCVGNDDDLRAVVLGADQGDGTRAPGGALSGMHTGRHLRRPHHRLGQMWRAN